MTLVDAHLDLAFNHFCFGRDVRESALETRRREGDKAKERWRGACMVGLPELRAARIAVVFPTIFLAPASAKPESGDAASVSYSTAEEAERLGLRQLDYYRHLADDASAGDAKGFRIVGSRADLRDVLSGWKDGAVGPIGFVPLMEGADPIREPDAASEWFDRGVRIVGLAWRRTRYSGGTGEPGPLTPEGRRLVRAMDESRLILDFSHAAEESFYEAIDLFEGPVIASHSNPRALCPGDRQLSDEMIRRIATRGGVIGIVPFNRLLVEAWADRGRASVPLSRVAEAIQHVVQTAGTVEAAAIGSDFDGGFGAEAAPEGLDTIADLPRLADALSDLAFPDDAIHGILGGNWIRFLERSLPSG